MGISIHSICSARCKILDEAQAERATAVLVALELANSCVGSLGVVESDDSGTTGPATWLVLDLGLLDLADSREEFDQIVVAGGPRKLRGVSYKPWLVNETNSQLTLRT